MCVWVCFFVALLCVLLLCFLCFGVFYLAFFVCVFFSCFFCVALCCFVSRVCVFFVVCVLHPPFPVDTVFFSEALNMVDR